MALDIKKFVRKPVYVDAVEITEENLKEVSKWCQGDVRLNDQDDRYIKVNVHHPMNDRQTMGFAGDLVLSTNSGFKVYTRKAFDQSFEPDLDAENEVRI